MHPRTHFSYAAFYSSKFILLGIQLPFFSGWLALKGVSASEIGLITGGALVMRLLLGPFVAYWADQQDDMLRGLKSLAFIFAASALALNLPVNNLAIAAASIGVMWSFGVLVPLVDTAVLRADRAGLANFGQARAIGSFAFLATTILGGEALTRLGLNAAAPIMAAAACAAFAVGLSLPSERRQSGPGSALNWRDVRALFSSKVFLLALAAAALVQGAHAVYYAFSILHWSSIGYSPRIVGMLWATGVIAEILLLTRMRAAARLLGPAKLIALGAGGAALRWSLIALEPPLPLLFLIQTMHALTFAATYIGTIEFIARAAPARLINTAMTLNSTAGVGAVTGLATIAGGYVFQSAGAGAAYFLMAGMGAIAFVLTLLLSRMWKGGRLVE